ncbi:TonB-dependent receptor [Gymnodinialimonas sp. 2305UL16-5]|uniref:TonB-dependent receptor n=1 Tax=Gymnodinialimonas mytili TaxID=3126503 RepID=UPI0030966A6D
MIFKCFACATVAATVAIPAMAQTNPDEPQLLGRIVLESFRNNSEVASIPGAVQVIEREDILRRAGDGQSLERVLSDFVPGLSPSNGTIGGASQTMRGRNLQILINGVARTSELRGFDRELALINPESIERIEVIRGSNAQLGNGATGGLINVITRGADGEPGTSVTTRLSVQPENAADSLGYQFSIGHNTSLGDLDLRFELSTLGMGDRFDGAGRLIPNDPIIGQGGGDNNQSYQFGLAAAYAWGANEIDLRFDASYFEQDIDFFTDYSMTPVSVTDRPYTGEPITDDTQAFTLTWRNDALAIGDVEVQAYASDNRRQAALVEPDEAANPLYYPISLTDTAQRPDGQSVLETFTYGLRSTVRTDLSGALDGSLLTWGVDLGRDEITTELLDGTPIIAPMDQSSYAAFAQIDIPLGDAFEVSAGVRYERFDLTVEDFVRPDAIELRSGVAIPLPALNVTGGDFDYDATVFNIGAVWSATDELDVFAGYSQGFSLPDVGAFTRRAVTDDPTASGQTISFGSIAPEAQIVDTIEVGVRYNTPVLAATASAFFSTSDEGTVFDPATNALSQQAEEIWGFEATADYRLSNDWNMGLITAFTEGRFDDDGDGSVDSWLPNNRIVAPFTATIYSDYAFANGLNVSGELVYTGERSHAGLSDLEETTRINLRGSLPLGSGEFGFGVDNLFDTDQLNPTASVVRISRETGNNIPVADEGRRLFASYTIQF